MKRIWICFAIAAILITSACQKKKEKVVLDSTEKKQSYVFGMNIAQQIKASGENIDVEVLIQGLRDFYSGKERLLNEQEVSQVLQEYQKGQIKKLADQNKAEEAKFLADNAKIADVKTTPSGLQYKVIKEGQGPKPKETDTVKVNYKGSFIDGQEFDSSYRRNQPAQFPLNGVIKGWTEGLQLMSIGSKYQFFVPYRLAYLEAGRAPTIPPAKMLIFEVELLEIVKPAAVEVKIKK